MPPLARKYAVILATLAVVVVFMRAVKDSAAPGSVVWTALGAMAVFWTVGLVLGWVAEAIVVESVKSQLEEQLQKQTASTQTGEQSARGQSQSAA